MKKIDGISAQALLRLAEACPPDSPSNGLFSYLEEPALFKSVGISPKKVTSVFQRVTMQGLHNLICLTDMSAVYLMIPHSRRRKDYETSFFDTLSVDAIGVFTTCY